MFLIFLLHTKGVSKSITRMKISNNAIKRDWSMESHWIDPSIFFMKELYGPRLFLQLPVVVLSLQWRHNERHGV